MSWPSGTEGLAAQLLPLGARTRGARPADAGDRSSTPPRPPDLAASGVRDRPPGAVPVPAVAAVTKPRTVERAERPRPPANARLAAARAELAQEGQGLFGDHHQAKIVTRSLHDRSVAWGSCEACAVRERLPLCGAPPTALGDAGAWPVLPAPSPAKAEAERHAKGERDHGAPNSPVRGAGAPVSQRAPKNRAPQCAASLVGTANTQSTAPVLVASPARRLVAAASRWTSTTRTG
jgi:hypothetical protein